MVPAPPGAAITGMATVPPRVTAPARTIHLPPRPAIVIGLQPPHQLPRRSRIPAPPGSLLTRPPRAPGRRKPARPNSAGLRNHRFRLQQRRARLRRPRRQAHLRLPPRTRRRTESNRLRSECPLAGLTALMPMCRTLELYRLDRGGFIVFSTLTGRGPW